MNQIIKQTQIESQLCEYSREDWIQFNQFCNVASQFFYLQCNGIIQF